jgi:hypothetical protein
MVVGTAAHFGPARDPTGEEMRGIIVNRARRCPSCGAETMRGAMPWLLRPLEALTAGRLTYRWCRRCRATWLSFGHRRA